MSTLTVLTPNGRRYNVKVEPNTALIKVLEQTCVKHDFDPNSYDLKHHKRIIDLTTSFRFAGLPNNALLEMVPAQKTRHNSEVELVVLTTAGNRVQGIFKPDDRLYDIFQHSCPEECNYDDLLAVYMRTEVTVDKFPTTSLKDLGLLYGRAMIRLMRRSPDAAKIQSHVALNLMPKPTSVENEVNPTVSKDSPTNSVLQQFRAEMAAKDNSNDPDVSDVNSNSVEPEPMSTTPATSPRMSPNHTEEAENPVVAGVEPATIKQEDIDEVHILGERKAVLFSLESAASKKQEEPDSFYALSVEDMKVLIKHLRADTAGNSNEPLKTAKLREMETQQSHLSLLNRYKTIVIRVQFPNRYVLQGQFTPYETIGSVVEFVRQYLLDTVGDFYLFTTPPKEILSNLSLRLFEANCIPSAVLHFGCDESLPIYLKDDVTKKLSSAKKALEIAFEDSRIAAKESVEASGSGSSASGSSSGVSQPASVRPRQQTQSSSTSHSSDEKKPKWFKNFSK